MRRRPLLRAAAIGGGSYYEAKCRIEINEIMKGNVMSAEEITEMGPIDYLLVEWHEKRPSGELAPLLIDLVEAGTIRILDLKLIEKDEDGSVRSLEAGDVEAIEGLELLLGASSGLLDPADIEEAAAALEPGTAAGLLVYENAWAASFATAVRRSGGQLVANGRIPVQAIVAALDAVEAE